MSLWNKGRSRGWPDGEDREWHAETKRDVMRRFFRRSVLANRCPHRPSRFPQKSQAFHNTQVKAP